MELVAVTSYPARRANSYTNGGCERSVIGPQIRGESAYNKLKSPRWVQLAPEKCAFAQMCPSAKAARYGVIFGSTASARKLSMPSRMMLGRRLGPGTKLCASDEG